MNEQFGLKKEVAEKIRSVFARHPQVERAVIYGSRAKGNFRKGSDVDITLIGDRVTFDVLLKIMNEIDELLLPYSFDISIYKTIKDDGVLDHIHRVGKVFYEKSKDGK